MGMFDHVEYGAPCYKCGEKLTDFQSKDAQCMMGVLEPKDVRCFYTICEKCQTWNEYEVIVQTFDLQLVKRERAR